MKILLIGLPGSGKGTQIKKIAEKLNLSKVQMGDLLRESAASGSQLGKKIGSIMETGDLVDDAIAAEVIKKRVEEVGGNDFIMEGFPRTLKQIALYDPGFDKVFYLDTPHQVVKDRLEGRNRQDDTAEAIEMRINVQARDLEAILNHYKDIMVTIDGTGSIDEVFENIGAHLK